MLVTQYILPLLRSGIAQAADDIRGATHGLSHAVKLEGRHLGRLARRKHTVTPRAVRIGFERKFRRGIMRPAIRCLDHHSKGGRIATVAPIAKTDDEIKPVADSQRYCGLEGN